MSKRSTRGWMRQHQRDPFVQEANARGYRSRAAFKLMQMDATDGLFKPGRQVVDLGAAPGGWSQVAAERVGSRGRVVAVDLLRMQALPGVAFIQGDFLQAAVRLEINSWLSGPADLVISDMAPNLTGVRARDQALALEIGLQVQEFAAQVLKSGGILVVKVFQGEDLAELQRAMAGNFAPVKVRKPRASRDRSTEIYLIACRR